MDDFEPTPAEIQANRRAQARLNPNIDGEDDAIWYLVLCQRRGISQREAIATALATMWQIECEGEIIPRVTNEVTIRNDTIAAINRLMQIVEEMASGVTIAPAQAAAVQADISAVRETIEFDPQRARYLAGMVSSGKTFDDEEPPDIVG